MDPSEQNKYFGMSQPWSHFLLRHLCFCCTLNSEARTLAGDHKFWASFWSCLEGGGSVGHESQMGLRNCRAWLRFMASLMRPSLALPQHRGPRVNGTPPKWTESAKKYRGVMGLAADREAKFLPAKILGAFKRARMCPPDAQRIS